MMRALSALALFAAVFSLNLVESPRKARLSAPTYYVAGRAEFGGITDQIRVRGATNLPPGAVLMINVYDFVGQGSAALSQEAQVTVNDGGFFETVLHPKPGSKFRHNLVCDLVFMPTLPRQPAFVQKAAGKNGDQLGFSENPQASVVSGGYYLSEMIHVP